MDRLTPILERFPPKVRLLFSGDIQGAVSMEKTPILGHLHWIEAGRVHLEDGHQECVKIDAPSIVFSPHGEPHRLIPHPQARIVSAEFDFGQRYQNPLTLIDPKILTIPIAEGSALRSASSLILEEAFADRCGRGFATSQLLQYFLLVLFRHLIATGALPMGVTKALGDDRLLKSVTAIHREPQKNWSLEHLAQVAGMSRASFAAQFKAAMGTTPLGYLTDWRISLAQSLIAQGVGLKSVASQVGYQSAAALSRVFTKHQGISPRRWREEAIEEQTD